jgi:hypothetical protein
MVIRELVPLRNLDDNPSGASVDDFRDVSDAALVVAVARFRGPALAEICRRHADAVFGLRGRGRRDSWSKNPAPDAPE